MTLKARGTIFDRDDLTPVDKTFDNMEQSFNLGPSLYAWLRLTDTHRWGIYEITAGGDRGGVKIAINGKERNYYTGTIEEGETFTAHVERGGQITANWTPYRR